MKKNNLFFILLFILSCSTAPKSNFIQSGSELQEVLKSEKLSEASQVRIKHAINDLKIADKQQKDEKKLQQDLVKESKLAGAGKLTYVLIMVGAAIALFFIGYKIIKRVKLPPAAMP